MDTSTESIIRAVKADAEKRMPGNKTFEACCLESVLVMALDALPAEKREHIAKNAANPLRLS